MKKISEKDVEHTAKLARIELSDNEIRLFQRQLGDVIGFFEELRHLETEGINPSFQINESVKNVLREDVEGNSFTQEEALSQSQMKTDQYFKVPKVLG